MATLTLTGNSGTSYEFSVYTYGRTFQAVGAVYAITRRDDEGRHAVIYVGQTGDLSERLDGHEKEPCFELFLANRTCTHEDDYEDSRRQKEADLIEKYSPRCNA